MAALKLKSLEENPGKMNEDIDDVISEKVKIESAKQQLRLENILTFKFQEMIENKMADVETKTETKLLSKYKKDFKNLEGKLRKQMKSTEDFHRNLVTNKEFLKLKNDFNNLKINVTKDLQKQCENLKKELKESSKNIIQDAFEEKCEEIERKTLNNVEVNCQRYSEEMKNDLNRVELQLKDEIENSKKDLKKDILTQNEEVKKILQGMSKTFIEDIVEVKYQEIENQSYNNLIGECKKYSEETKRDLSNDLKINLKQNLENERTILLKEIKSEVNAKGDEIKLNAIQELKDELTKRLQNQISNLEKSFNEKYEREKLKMEDDLKKQISSQVQCDIDSLSKRLDVISPRTLNFTWEIQDFKDQLSNTKLSIESEVFHLNETGPKVKFVFHPYFMDFEVKYVDQPSNDVFPLNGHHRITFIVHDQVDNQSHNDFIRIFELRFQVCSDKTLRPQLATKDDLAFLISRWLKNGKMQVNLKLEPLNQLIALEPRHHGRIIWKIDNFKDVCESYHYGRQYSLSEAFYSSEKGYRMKGYLFVDDEVYFRLYFLKGPWDKKLPKKFNHRTTISLISQKDPSELKNKTISKKSDSTDWDFINDFTKSDLENYVTNDSIIISFKVEAL